MSPRKALCLALFSAIMTTHAWAQPATPSDADKAHQAQFRRYIASLEVPSNDIVNHARAALTKDELARLPASLRVRIGWAFTPEANRVTGCGDLLNPASVQHGSGTIWLCEEGIRTITALTEVLQITSMAALLHANGNNKALSKQPTPAMLDLLSHRYKAWAAPAVRYLIEQHVDQVNARLLNRQASFACPAHVIAYLAVHAPSGQSSIQCTPQGVPPETDKSAAAWYGKVLGESALGAMTALGMDTTETRAKIEASEVTPAQWRAASAEVREQVLTYFILHEIGHLTQPGVVAASSTPGAQVQAEIQADRFAFDSRLGALQLKPMIGAALATFWHQLIPYSSQASATHALAVARGRSIEHVMCDGHHPVLDAPAPAIARQLQDIQRLGCLDLPALAGSRPAP